MSHPTIIRGSDVGMFSFLPILILLTGCGLTGSGKLADNAKSETIVDVIAEKVEAETANEDALEAEAPQATLAENHVTQRALGRSPDEITIDMPPIPLRSAMPVSSSTNLLKKEPASEAAAVPNLTDRTRPTVDTISTPARSQPVAAEQLAPSTPRHVEQVSADNFHEIVLASNVPVIVDFYADWCGPCKRLAPLLEQVARERVDPRVVKVNGDHDKELARKYRVRSYPTVILFREGTPVARYVGLGNIRRGLGL